MFWAVVTDIYTILFGIMLFSLFLWIGILALRVIIGLLGAVSEYKPLLIIEQILGFYKIIEQFLGGNSRKFGVKTDLLGQVYRLRYFGFSHERLQVLPDLFANKCSRW